MKKLLFIFVGLLSLTARAATISSLPNITAPASDTILAIYTNNGSGTFGLGRVMLTNLVIRGPEILLNPPRAGFGLQPYPLSLHASDFSLLSGPATAGIVLDLTIQPDISAGLHNFAGNMPNVSLQVFPDCGSFTNNASLTNPAVNVPLADLFGARFRYSTNGQWSIKRTTRWLDSTDVSTNRIYGGPIHLLRLKLPMPFTNGCVARLQQTQYNTNWPHGYIGATVEQRNLDALGRFSNWRLHSVTTNSASFGGAASNYLFSVTGAGLLVGWTQSLFDNEELGDVVGFTDSRGPNFYTPAGQHWMYYLDDFLQSTYGGVIGLELGFDNGLTHLWMGPNNDAASQALEGYRWFHSDGFYWTNGITVSHAGAAPSPVLVGHQATMLYYAP